MIITLDDERMLEIWREGAGLEPALADASIERYDGRNVLQVLRTAMRAWYIDYLRTGPEHLVPVSDLTRYARLNEGPRDDQWTLELICDTARIVSIDIDGYGRLRLIDPDAAGTFPAMGNRFVRCGKRATAFYRPGTNYAILNIDSVTAPKPVMVRGVEITGDEEYVVDEQVLAEIAQHAQKALYG